MEGKCRGNEREIERKSEKERKRAREREKKREREGRERKRANGKFDLEQIKPIFTKIRDILDESLLRALILRSQETQSR